MPPKTVLFLCPHGGAKSVIAAAFFNRAMEADREWRAEAAAAEDPYESVPDPVARLLSEEGFHLGDFRPQAYAPAQLAAADLVVTIDCQVPRPASHWEGVPKVSEDLRGSAEILRRRAEELASSLRRTPSLRQLAMYFLRLGALGFGGPIALAGAMQRDLVEERGWVSEEEYRKGLALAQLAPGPLAAQLAIYLGWANAGIRGATVIALAFVLPSLLMVLAISAAYVRFGGLPWMQSAFYGIGAAVIAIIARSAWKLAGLTLRGDPLLWIIFGVNAVATAALQREVLSLIAAGGLLAWLARGRVWRAAPALCLAPSLLDLFWFFSKAGAFVFGSGLAIVPFLYGGVVQEYGWLNEQQFLDAVAVAMITPGPVVITVAFIGYLVSGVEGALVAALGVFLPCYLLVIIPAPYYARFAGDARLRSFVAGVTAAATGAIAGAVVVLGSRAIIDVPTILIFSAAMILLLSVKRLPEPLLIAAAGAAAILIR